LTKDFEYDIFICHAGEDKDEIAKPLAEALTSKKLHVWYDEFSLKIGDSLLGKIDHGLSNSRYGIVILSPSFFGKNWPEKELSGLVSREDGREKVILPVWHHVTKEDVARYHPILADRKAALSEDGIDSVVQKIGEVMASEPTRFDRIIDLEAERRLLGFFLTELDEELSNYVQARGKEPDEEEVKEARRLLSLEPDIGKMDFDTVSDNIEKVRASIEEIDELWDAYSQALEPY
jgi:hypothetical protein